MFSVTLPLPSSILSALNFRSYRDDFCFISPDGILECPLCIAELLSPVIRDLRKTDPSITTFTFPSSINLTHLSQLLSVAKGCSFPVPLEDFSSYHQISESLGSTSLLFDSSFLEQPILPENVVQTFLIRQSLHLTSESQITFLAKRLHEIPLDTLNDLPLSTLSEILSRHEIAITSEHSLFAWILDHPPASGFHRLLEHICFDALPPSSMALFEARFLELLPHLSDGAVRNLWDRLLLPVQPRTADRCPPQLRVVDCRAEGIICALGAGRGVVVAASGGLQAPQALLRSSDDAVLMHFSPNDNVIKYDFLEAVVAVTRWRIKVRHLLQPGTGYKVNVVLETGADGKVAVIDSGWTWVKGNDPVVYEADIAAPIKGTFLQVRFIAALAPALYWLGIMQIEFFGTAEFYA